MGSSSSINFGYKGRKWSRDTDFNSSRLPLSSCSSFNKLTTTSNHIFKHKNLASPSLLPLQRRERLGSISCTKLLRFSSITDGSSVIASRTRRRVNWKSSLPWNLTKYHQFLQINKTQKIKVLRLQNWSFLSVMSFFLHFQMNDGSSVIKRTSMMVQNYLVWFVPLWTTYCSCKVTKCNEMCKTNAKITVPHDQNVSLFDKNDGSFVIKKTNMNMMVQKLKLLIEGEVHLKTMGTKYSL